MKSFILVKLTGIALTLFLALNLGSCGNQAGNDWKPIFNGENLDGWAIKIRGFELGENHKNTFRVEDGILKVSYDEYETFDDKFGPNIL